jgi:hypothetical protein
MDAHDVCDKGMPNTARDGRKLGVIDPEFQRSKRNEEWELE